jgi:hypothetical protein
MFLESVSLVIGAVTLILVVYEVWRNLLCGPDIKVIEFRFLGSGASHGVPQTWNWTATIHNEGSRGGEIREFHLENLQIEPSTLLSAGIAFQVAGNMNGIYQKGDIRHIDFHVSYVRSGSDEYLTQDKVTKATVTLVWQKETRKGFKMDQLCVQLIPRPQVVTD